MYCSQRYCNFVQNFAFQSTDKSRKKSGNLRITGTLVGSLQGNNNHHERCAKVPVNQARAQSRNYRFLGFAHYRTYKIGILLAKLF